MVSRIALVIAALSLALATTACPSTKKPATKKQAEPSGTPDVQARLVVNDGDPPVKREYRELALKNVCPKGYDDIQGKWRFIGDSRCPEYSEELHVTGTKFVNLLSGKPDGVETKARIEGEIRCLFKNRVLWMVDRVEPEGAFDNRSGDFFPCDVLNSMEHMQDQIMYLCFFEWDLSPSKSKEFEYKKIE